MLESLPTGCGGPSVVLTHGRDVSRYCEPFMWKRLARRSSNISFHIFLAPLVPCTVMELSHRIERHEVGRNSRSGFPVPISDGQRSTPSIPWMSFVSGSVQSSAGSTPANLLSVWYQSAT